MSDIINNEKYETEYSDKLAELREEFETYLLADSDYIYKNGDDIVYEPKDMFKMPMVISLKSVRELSDAIQGIGFTLPTKPALLDASTIQRYNTHIFDDARLDQFETDLRAIYGNFTIPDAYRFNAESLQDAIQTSLYTRGFALDTDDMESKIDDMAGEWAADGYLRPPGAMAHEIGEEIGKLDRKRTGQTENIFTALAKTVQQNIQWSFENGISIEKLHMDFTLRFSELSKELIGAATDAYIAEITKRRQELEASLKKVDTEVKAMALDVEADIKKNELELSENSARLQSYVSSMNSFIDSEAQLIIEKIKLGKSIADGYGAIFGAYGAGHTGISIQGE